MKEKNSMRSRLLAGMLVLLCACSPPSDARIVEKPVALHAIPDVEQPARQTLVLLLDSEADEPYRAAADRLADKALALTDQMLEVEIRATATPVRDFQAGEGDLVFLDSTRSPAFCPEIQTLALPLLYKDYDQFTMSLHSPRMMEFLQDAMADQNALPLAAFYRSSSHLVTARPREGGNIVLTDPPTELELEGLLRAGDPVAALPSDSTAAGLMEAFGMEVVTEDNWTARMLSVFSGDAALGEFSHDEIREMDFDGSDATVLSIGHSMHPVFLLADNSRFQALPSHYQAALLEGVAYLYPVIDNSYRQQEEDLNLWLRQQGVTVERSYPALREAAAAYIQEQAASDPRTRYLINLISSME